jgi:hypothetical protein
MDRQTLFHASLAVYGALFVVDTLLAALAGEFTLTHGGTGAAATLVLVGAVYGLANPERAGDATDSWLAYLAAVGAFLVAVGVVPTWF